MPYGESNFAVKLGRKLHNIGWETQYVPKNQQVLQELEQLVKPNQILSGHLSHSPVSNLEYLTEKYGISSVKSFIFPQMVYDYRYSRPAYDGFFPKINWAGPKYCRYEAFLHRTLDYFDTVFENGGGGIPIQHQGAEILRRVLESVSKHYNYKSAWVGFSPVEGRSALYPAEQFKLSSIEESKYENLTTDEKRKATKLIAETVNKQPEMGAEKHYSNRLSPLTILQSIQHKISRVTEEGTDIVPVVNDWIRRNILRPMSAKNAKRRYLGPKKSEKIIANTDYIYFPLQYFRESRVTVRASPYYNQAWIVEYLSRNCPVGHNLVVKDHPQQLGAQPRQSVKSISTHSIAVWPSTNSHDIVSKASAVIILNNTVGYEAVLHGKPVLVLGDAFYSGYGYTIDVKDTSQISEKLYQAVNSEYLTDEDIVEFAAGIINGSYPGVWGKTPSENIEKLSHSLTSFLQE